MAVEDDEILMKMLSDPQQCDRGFRLLLKEYGTKLYWHIRRIVVSHDDAEDAMQETSIKIYTKIRDFKGDSALQTWIYKIATNEALQELRKRAKLFQTIDSESVRDSLTESLVSENPMDGEAAEILFQKALLTLPTQQRIAFNMRYYDELSYDEIASITGKKVNTLKTNYHFAVEKVKKYLNDNAL